MTGTVSLRANYSMGGFNFKEWKEVIYSSPVKKEYLESDSVWESKSHSFSYAVGKHIIGPRLDGFLQSVGEVVKFLDRFFPSIPGASASPSTKDQCPNEIGFEEDRLRDLFSQAYNLTKTSQHEKSLELFEEVVGGYERIYADTNHINILRAKNNICVIYRELGDSEKELQCFRSLLNQYQHINFTKDGSDLFFPIPNICIALSRLNKKDEAFFCYERAQELHRRAFKGEENSDLAQILSYKCITYLHEDKTYRDAILDCDKSVEICERLEECKNKCEYIVVLINKGSMYIWANKLEEGITIYKKAIKIEANECQKEQDIACRNLYHTLVHLKKQPDEDTVQKCKSSWIKASV